MELWEPVIFNSPSISVATKYDETAFSKKNDDEEFTFDFFYSDDANIKGDGSAIEADLEKKVKKSRAKPADPSTPIRGTKSDRNIANNPDVSYIDSYAEIDNLTKGTIMQIDKLSTEVQEDIEKIRSSSSMKGKYTYLTNLVSASASLLSSRQQAIRDLKGSITDAHNLDLKRAKDLKSFELEKQNDDARMMDLYSAFINAPMGMYDNKLNMPTVPDMMLGTNDPNSGIRGVSMAGGVSNAQSQLTPEQVRLRMEGNNNIEEIVVFDPATGRKWFDVIDKTTGQSVPNYPRSDAFLLDDVSIETRAGVAKNRNLDRVWPLQVLGNAIVSEY